jgi:hypothetical protein
VTTFVYRNGQLVDKRYAPPKVEGDQAAYVISDIMPETRHMANGKTYTSKSEYRKATKAAGCIEVGNETSTLLKPRKPIQLDRGQRREDIKRTIYEMRNQK